jgi:hypothetical protein
MFQHFAYNALAGCDIARETNNVFTRPLAHKYSTILDMTNPDILMSFGEISNTLLKIPLALCRLVRAKDSGPRL